MLMLCPICAGEYYKQSIDCPNCGCNLVPEMISSESPVATREEPSDRIEFVELCRPRIYPIAMLIKQTMEQHGIAVYVQGANAASVLPQLAFGGDLRVLVDRLRSDFARELYKAYFENDEDVDYILETEVD